MIAHELTRDAVGTAFLDDETTIELLARARAGDRDAVETLLQRCLPSLKRWAHGKLPSSARAFLDTGDIVQEAALHAVRRLDTFEPRHVGAMQAYLRQSVINRIIDEVRRVARQPVPVELEADLMSHESSPMEVAIEGETYERYRAALGRLKSRHREIVVARIEMQWSISQIKARFEFASIDAARMAVTRALGRLAADMHALSHA
jgi:RNA polymerase sigma-70 factor, ECF subfamily